MAAPESEPPMTSCRRSTGYTLNPFFAELLLRPLDGLAGLAKQPQNQPESTRQKRSRIGPNLPNPGRALLLPCLA